MCDNVMLITYKVLLPYETVVILPISTIASAHMLLLLLLIYGLPHKSESIITLLYLTYSAGYISLQSVNHYTEVY